MRAKTRAEVNTAIEQTGEASAEIRRLQGVTRKEIDEIAKKYSRESSSFLAGIIGGIAGAAGGVAFHGALGALAVVTGPAGAALGVALAIVAWRGPAQWRLERATERARVALDQIQTQIAKLPKNTPPNIQQQLWDGYSEITQQYIKLAAPAVGEADDRKPQLPAQAPPQKLLS